MAPGSDAGGPPDAGAGVPSAVQQEVVGFDQAQQASQGSGVQNNYFRDTDPQTEPAVSIAAPSGNWTSASVAGPRQLLAALTDTAAGLRVKVVHGLGGCGKTRLALEVASRAQERGTEVWWVSASDENRLAAGMHAVGRQLGVTDSELRHGEAADLVWQRLAGRQQAWLLVIDNADDPQVLAGPTGRVGDGTGWLRPSPHCRRRARHSRRIQARSRRHLLRLRRPILPQLPVPAPGRPGLRPDRRPDAADRRGRPDRQLRSTRAGQPASFSPTGRSRSR